MDSSVYQRPTKPLYKPVSRREVAPAMALPQRHIVAEVSRLTECHVTPLCVSQLMVDYFCSYDSDQIYLEPSCGTGNLISALLGQGILPEKIKGIERETSLHGLCSKRFDQYPALDLLNQCFIEYAKTNKQNTVDRILMNPPFRKVTQHINAALSLLKSDGQLIALVPITFDHPLMDTLQILPNDTFEHIKINTKLISIER